MPDGYRHRYMLAGQLIRRGSSAFINPNVLPAPVSPAPFTTFAYGTVKPFGAYDDKETGTVNVGPRFPLTRYDGNVTIATGDVVQGLDIYGRVTFTGPGILRDCIVRGSVASLGVPGGASNRLTEPLATDVGVVGAGARNMRGCLIEWSRLDALGYESAWQYGIDGGNFTCRYSEIHGVVDGAAMSMLGGGKLLGCRISDSYYTGFLDTATGLPRAGFPQDAEYTHTDGVHISRARGWQIIGCFIGGPRSSAAPLGPTNADPAIPTQLAVMEAIDDAADYAGSAIRITTPGASAPVSAFINRNWLQGGAATMIIDATAADHMSGVIVTNNRFIRPSSGLAINQSDKSTATLAGNVYDDDDSPVTVSSYVGA